MPKGGPPRRSPGNGTLVDTWHYETTVPLDRDEDDGPDLPEAEVRIARKVAVELRLVKEFDQTGATPPYPTRSVRFKVVCKEVALDLEGTDVEVLRAAA